MKIAFSLAGRVIPGQEFPKELDLADGASLAEALAKIRSHLPSGNSLSPTWLVVVSGEHVGTIARYSDRPLRSGDELLLLAPVAGG